MRQLYPFASLSQIAYGKFGDSTDIVIGPSALLSGSKKCYDISVDERSFT